MADLFDGDQPEQPEHREIDPMGRETIEDVKHRLLEERAHILGWFAEARGRLSQVEGALKALGVNVTASDVGESGLKVRRTYIRNLAEHIVDTVRDHGKVITSHDLTERMYTPELGITKDLFRRRVIVTASSLYNRESPKLLDSKYRRKGKEVWWMLPEWADDSGNVQPDRLPSPSSGAAAME